MNISFKYYPFLTKLFILFSGMFPLGLLTQATTEHQKLVPGAGTSSANPLAMISQLSDLPSMKHHASSPFQNSQLPHHTDILKHQIGMTQSSRPVATEQFQPQVLAQHCLPKPFNFLHPNPTTLGMTSLMRREFASSAVDFDNVSVSAVMS